MKSMTGFGKSSAKFENKIINVEIRTLNAKQIDINTRIPNLYREIDLKIHDIIKQKLERGKIDCVITTTNAENNAPISLNKELFIQYYKQLSQIADEISADKTLLPYYILMREDVNATVAETLSENEVNTVLNCVTDALNEVENFRITEGIALKSAFDNHISVIEKLLTDIEPFEKGRIERIREKILARFEEITTITVDEARFEQEIIFYLEKLDVTEEKIRLNQHINYLKQCINATDPVGKKLMFVSQEIGREINTLGSKSNDANIQKIVVMFKDELEKIKEQAANVL